MNSMSKQQVVIYDKHSKGLSPPPAQGKNINWLPKNLLRLQETPKKENLTKPPARTNAFSNNTPGC